MARARNYQAEYARRLERNLARGHSRSQARGHPRRGEAYVSRATPRQQYDRTLEEGLKEVRAGKPLSKAARSLQVSPERLRTYIGESGVAEKQRSRWRVIDDPRPRRVPIFTEGVERIVTVAGYEPSRRAGTYVATVYLAVDRNDPSLLEPFVGDGVRDTRGRWHPFETRMNELYRLTAGGPVPYEQIYRIVA